MAANSLGAKHGPVPGSDLNNSAIAYAKLWTQLTLVHSQNARSRSIL